jgi:hypothetical protein
MPIERATRCLSAIGSASSNRVLNLNALAQRHAGDPAHHALPLFFSPIINTSIILKHRLRADEGDEFQEQRSIATKIIIPFEKNNLRSGGRSMFVDQSDFEQLLSEVGNYRSAEDMARDLFVLRLLDSLPSILSCFAKSCAATRSGPVPPTLKSPPPTRSACTPMPRGRSAGSPTW